MARKIPPLVWFILPLVWLLYFHGLSGVGLLGPDEPRYASIGREMAHSGDWVTPRLWGQPWFEKPALLYWMIGAGFRAGLGPDLAPRLPVALMAVAFLVIYWWALRREFGARAAWMASLILGSSGGWLAFSHAAVTDLPLSAAFAAAMLLALPWIAKGDSHRLPAVAALLGLAVLAKGLVPLVLAAPLAMGFLRRGSSPSGGRLWRSMAFAIGSFLAVALPWYLLCYLRNGSGFLADFFWRHHLERFTSSALAHTEPWWFYLPVLAALLLPWLPLAGLGGVRAWRGDPRRLYLLVWLVFGLVFFSLAANKLPGYLLPLLPAAAALMGVALDEASSARPWLAACALLLVAFPIAAQVLPAAMNTGILRAPLPVFHWTWLLPVGLAAAAWLLDARGLRVGAVLSVALGVAAGAVYVLHTDAPRINHASSARGLWRWVAGRAGDVCVEDMQRGWRYGLNYYSVVPLPECSQSPRPLRIRQDPGHPPGVLGTDVPGAVDPVSLGVVPSLFRN